MGVFVCEDARDAAAVEILVPDLLRAGQQVVRACTFGHDEVGWTQVLDQIRDCDVFIFALSQHALASRTCMAAYEYAKALRRTVIPVQVGPVDEAITNPLSSLQHVDYREPTVSSGIELTAALHDHLSHPNPLPDPLPPSPGFPFDGLDRLTAEVSAPGLSGSRQAEVLAELDGYLKRDGRDAVLRRRVGDVLELLAAHPGLRARHRPQVLSRLGAFSEDLPPGSGQPAGGLHKRVALVAAGVGAIAATLVAAIAFWPRPEPDLPPPAPAAKQAEVRPQTETVTLTVLQDSILVGSSNAATIIDLYTEPICTECGTFVSTYMDDLERALREQKMAVRFYVLGDGRSAGDYSARAAGAVYCVAAAADVGLFEDFYAGLLAPAFQSKAVGAAEQARTNLVDLANSVAAPAPVVKCTPRPTPPQREPPQRRRSSPSCSARHRNTLWSYRARTTSISSRAG